MGVNGHVGFERQVQRQPIDKPDTIFTMRINVNATRQIQPELVCQIRTNVSEIIRSIAVNLIKVQRQKSVHRIAQHCKCIGALTNGFLIPCLRAHQIIRI